MMAKFFHIGTAGDVLYSLPTVAALGGGEFVLAANALFPEEAAHLQGKVMLPLAVCESLKPLIEYQPFISTCGIQDAADVPAHEYVDLNEWRFQVTLVWGNSPLPERYFIAHTTTYPLEEPWLEVPEIDSCCEGLSGTELNLIRSNPILVNLTHRVRNPFIDHSALSIFADEGSLLFVGLPDEYDTFVDMYDIRCPSITATTFLQLASIISNARAFVGNMSACWVLADALKVPRLLEVYLLGDHARPYGLDGYAAVNQPAYDAAFERLFGVAAKADEIQEG